MSSRTDQGPPQRRAALYVDGLNLFHRIHETGEEHLKWISLPMLASLLARPRRLEIVKTVLCTAVPKHLRAEAELHRLVIAAQTAQGVEVLKGHFVPEGATGKFTEKQSDINVALSVMMDGLHDVFDTAFLLSADSDQVATARFFQKHLAPAGKRLIGVMPIRTRYPSDYRGLIDVVVLNREDLESAVSPARITTASGRTITRPAAFAPPLGWIHPDDRTQRTALASAFRQAHAKGLPECLRDPVDIQADGDA